MDENKPPGEFPSAHAYGEFLHDKWSLRLSELITKDEMMERQLKKAQEAIANIKKNKNASEDLAKIRAEVPSIENYYFSYRPFIKPHWEAFKQKHSGMPIETIWDVYIKETEDDLIELGGETEVKTVRATFEPLINKIKDEKSKPKSMFSRFNPFSKKTGGKKRSRKTKKRRR